MSFAASGQLGLRMRTSPDWHLTPDTWHLLSAVALFSSISPDAPANYRSQESEARDQNVVRRFWQSGLRMRTSTAWHLTPGTWHLAPDT